jgi:hypothetical protein
MSLRWPLVTLHTKFHEDCYNNLSGFSIGITDGGGIINYVSRWPQMA